MKKIVVHSIILFAIIIGIDRLAGFCLQKMFYKQNHGDDAVSITLIQKTKAAVLFLGSSRASHHYNSSLIEQQISKTVYNGGRDNMGIHYINSVIPIVLARYKPSYIVLDLMPNNFLKGSQNKQSYLDIQSATLLPFAAKYNSIFTDIAGYNPLEATKAKYIASYAYNSLVGSIFQNTYTNLGHIQIKGYEPIIGQIDPSKKLKEVQTQKELENEVDTSAIRLLKQSIAICKNYNCKVVVVFSPFYFYHPVHPLIKTQFDAISQQFQIPIIDYTTNSNFYNQPHLFYDELHLNATGANKFSMLISNYLKQ
jgi:hypothetical protein